MTTKTNKVTAKNMKLTLTTKHAAASYGVPVLVDENGTAYGPSDILSTGETAKSFVSRFASCETHGDKLGDESQDPMDPIVETEFFKAFTK